MSLLPINIKFRIVLHPGTVLEDVVTEDNFLSDFAYGRYPRYMIGLNGLLYEDYGIGIEPDWKPCFDTDYRLDVLIDGSWVEVSQHWNNEPTPP